MAPTRQDGRPSPWGRITIRRTTPKRGLTHGAGGTPPVGRSLHTWRPSAELSADLPRGFRIEVDCLAGGDRLRRFAPARGVEPFLLQASLGGLAVLARTEGLDAETRFAYHAMRLIFQHAPLLREHYAREFRRGSDLLIPGVERPGRDFKDVLPARLGMRPGDVRGRWNASTLLKRGRALAVEAGGPDPDERRCIAAGLFGAARLDPLDPAGLPEAEARGLVRMALFDVGPPGAIVDEAAKQAVAGRLLAAIGRHRADDAAAFGRWFFELRDGLIHQIAKQKKGGGPIDREVVRQALLDLVWDSYTYIGDCVCLQMQAFLQALPDPLGPAERAWFGAVYFKQPWLGGLPLILLRERFAFLEDAVLGVLEAPGEAGPVGVLLRLMQYYAEMASLRREVDRGYKERSNHRDARGRPAATFPLRDEPPDPRAAASGDRFQEIAARLLERRGIRHDCAAGGSWRASLDDDEAGDDVLILEFECDACGRCERIEVPRREFELSARELYGPTPDGAGGRPGPATDA